jgi:hypothetical protein
MEKATEQRERQSSLKTTRERNMEMRKEELPCGNLKE